MVGGSATSFSNNGVRDWLVQRVTAVILALYAIFLLGFFIVCGPVTFDAWHLLFSNVAMKVFTFLALLSVLGHAWVGIWTVLTDYIKCSCLRITLEIIVIIALIVYVLWGFQIVWSV